MPQQRCTQLKEELEKLHTLKSEFDTELTHAVEFGNTRKARQLHERLQKEIPKLKEHFFVNTLVEYARKNVEKKFNARFAAFDSSLR